MDIKLYTNNINILKEIDGITNNNINEIYNKENIETNNKEYIWDLISTTLFLQDKQCGHDIFNEILSDEKSMKKEVIDPSFEYDDLCYFLDENNKPICDICDFNFDEQEIEYYNKEHEESLFMMDDDKYEKYFSSTNYFENFDSYEKKDILFNKCLLGDDGAMDYCKFVKKIRNSLAHSNYEIIDDKNIRIYEKDSKGNYIFNIKINNIVVINLIDYINKYIYKKVKSDDDVLNDILEECCIKSDINDDYFIDNLLFKKLNLVSNKKTILKEISNLLQRGLVFNNKRSLYYCSIIEKIMENNQNNLNLCLVLDDFLCKKFTNESEDYDAFLYDRKFLGEANNNIKYDVLIYAFLINNLSRAYNQNKEKFINNFNFDKFELDDKSLEFMNQEIKNVYDSFNLQIDGIDKKLKKEATKYSNNTKQLEKNKTSNNLKQIEIMKKRIEENKNNIKSIEERKKSVLNDRELSKERTKREFILKHLRNSLVHGNAILPTNIDFSDLNNVYIQFYDFNTEKDKNNEETFYSKIKLIELIDMLTTHETINNLYKAK